MTEIQQTPSFGAVGSADVSLTIALTLDLLERPTLATLRLERLSCIFRCLVLFSVQSL